MPRLTPLLIGLALIPATARAELSVGDVWARWVESFAGIQGAIRAAQTEDTASGLILKDVTARIAPTPAMPETIWTIAEIRLTESGGGVDIRVSPETRITMRGPTATGRTDLAGIITLGHGTTRAEGTPTHITYAWDHDRIHVATAGTTVTGGVAAETTTQATLTGFTGEMAQTPAGGRIALSLAELTTTSQTLSQGSEALIEARHQNATLDGSYAFTGHVEWPVSLDARFAIGPSGQKVAMILPEGPVTLTTDSAQASGRLSATPERVEFDVAGQDGHLTLDPGAAPMSLPVMTFALGEVTALARVPVDLRDSAPWRIRLGLGPVTVGDETWARFDPEGHIPRTPGRLSLELGGTMAPFAGSIVAAPDQALRPDRLEVTELVLGLGGATLRGNGGFDFAIDPATGTPAPEGLMRLTLEGGLALIGQLSAAGIVQPQHMMGLQMMLGMMAVQDGSADRVSSIIETGPGHRVTINGMQIR